MTLEVQYKINSDINNIRFLRENPRWYKQLNRNPEKFREFIMDMRDKYELKPTDKLNKLLGNITMLQSFIDVLK